MKLPHALTHLHLAKVVPLTVALKLLYWQLIVKAKTWILQMKCLNSIMVNFVWKCFHFDCSFLCLTPQFTSLSTSVNESFQLGDLVHMCRINTKLFVGYIDSTLILLYQIHLYDKHNFIMWNHMTSVSSEVDEIWAK